MRGSRNLEASTSSACPAPVVERNRRAAYGAFAEQHGLLYISIVVIRGQHVYEGFQLQNVNNYESCLKRWMRRFNGVATKYLGWWHMIDHDGDRLTMTWFLAVASVHAAT